MAVRAWWALILGCLSAQSLSQFGASGQLVRWRTLASGTNARETKQFFRDAGDEASFQNLWNGPLGEFRPLPKVDFAKDRVVVFIWGQKPSGGYGVRVTGITATGGTTAAVQVLGSTPSRDSATTMALTSPWTAIAVDRSYSDFSLKFTEAESAPGFALGSSWFTPNWNLICSGGGGRWQDDQGFLFDDFQGCANWFRAQRIDLPPSLLSFNFQTQVLGVVLGVSGSDYQVTRVFGTQAISQNATMVYLYAEPRRGRGEPSNPWFALGLSRATRRIATTLVNAPERALVGSFPIPAGRPLESASGSSMGSATELRSGAELEAWLGKGVTRAPGERGRNPAELNQGAVVRQIDDTLLEHPANRIWLVDSALPVEGYTIEKGTATVIVSTSLPRVTGPRIARIFRFPRAVGRVVVSRLHLTR